MSHKHPILIASSGLDEGSWRPVAEHLERAHRPTLVYEADLVAAGRRPFEMRVTASGKLLATYDGLSFSPELVAAAWYRRPNMFSADLDDRALQNTLDTERRVLQYGLWSAVDRRAWVTEPLALYHAEHKLVQLRAAAQVGFVVPETLVVNNWEQFRLDGSRVVYKPSYGTLFDREGMRLLYTTVFANDKAVLPTEGLPFPGLWQPFVGKAREWRVTVIGDDVFPAAIYTHEDAKDDWRRHQLASDHVRFERGSLPDDITSLCLAYMRRLGLGFGAFDLVEDAGGAITFLECNANGQFGWLEGELGLPLSAAMASLLMQIADSSLS